MPGAMARAGAESYQEQTTENWSNWHWLTGHSMR